MQRSQRIIILLSEQEQAALKAAALAAGTSVSDYVRRQILIDGKPMTRDADLEARIEALEKAIGKQ